MTREANNARARRWYSANRDKAHAANKKWRDKNLEYARSLCREYSKRNKQKRSEKWQEYYKANKERLLANSKAKKNERHDRVAQYNKEYYAKNRDYHRARSAKYRLEHAPEIKEKLNRYFVERRHSDPSFKILTNLRKSREKYGEGKYIGAATKIKNELHKILRVGGRIITLGYDTVGMANKRGFKKIAICLICHGGDHNDTIGLVEEKYTRELI